jgi:UDP-N-acetylmuramoyl-L-alanyl-D-glutamate--2,6-diaminopimelate ligase
LDNALTYIKAITSGKVILVFGAPGKRDVFKRPEMGAIADQKADILILTDDDADSENRIGIISDILPGIKRNE